MSLTIAAGATASSTLSNAPARSSAFSIAQLLRAHRAQVVLRDALKEHTDIDEGSLKQLSMLRILHASCITALDAFRAADNPVDAQLVIDLETMVERTRAELERFANLS